MSQILIQMRLDNAAYALRMGLIDWFQYFEICREVSSGL